MARPNLIKGFSQSIAELIYVIFNIFTLSLMIRKYFYYFIETFVIQVPLGIFV